MAKITLYRHGMTGGIPPMKNDHVRAKRGKVGGWSEGATRRNIRFLRSVIETELHGVGFAVTLTLRHCPESPDDWHKLRRQWEARMRRAGMIRMHWVTEWQRRGVPHMHVAIWWPEEMVSRHGTQRIKEKMHGDWVMLASEYGAGYKAQRTERIYAAVGWFQYVSKHAARGVKHYQRSGDNIPGQWQKQTGRVWGKVGHWPVQDEVSVYLDEQWGDGGWFVYRRLARSWRIADARASGEKWRIRSARTMRRCHNVKRSRVRGISEWISGELNVQFLQNLAARGYSISATPEQISEIDKPDMTVPAPSLDWLEGRDS